MASTHNCGTTVPSTVGDYVEHLAACPETGPEMGAWCRQIVARVSRDAAETTPSEMADMRDAGKTLREIAAIVRVSPETVRRQIAKHKKEGGS